MKTINILFAGVGGQGIVSASDILADMALCRGYDVKKSEVHGMSQRGGVVSGFVRYGDKVYSPIPLSSEINYLVSFEEMETLRFAGQINPGTTVIVNMKKIKPAALAAGSGVYPDVKSGLKNVKAYFLEASEEAKKLGSEKVEGSVMLGALCSFLGFEDAEFKISLDLRMKKYTEENLKAFSRGKELVK
jgi:indolepyruvate ferredoxin oxidoreductase beta subunit